MNISIKFVDTSLVQIEFEPDSYNSAFSNFFSKTFEGTHQGRYIVHTSSFIQKYNQVRNFFREFSNELTPILSQDLKNFITDLPSYESTTEQNLSEKEIEEKLVSSGFKRKLKWFQLRNVKFLNNLNCGANFSVPGAGKTTDALAFYFLKKNTGKEKLLIISPINAYLAWKDDIKACATNPSEIIKIRGSVEQVNEILLQEGEFFWTNYQTLQNENKLDNLINFIIRNGNITVILDESHRGKGPDISSRLIKLAPFPENKLILTGTPMPQEAADLRSQFSFLFPKNNILSDEDFVDAFQPFYIRTTDGDLGLKPLDIKYIKVKPYQAHEEFYETYVRQGLIDGLSLESIFKLNSIEYAYMRYIRFMSNPRSISDITFDIDAHLSNRLDEEGDGAKIDAVVKRASELALKGEKVLIWSSFVKNVERIASRLNHFGSEFIHGGVKTESTENPEEFEPWSEEDLETREAKITRFKEDSDTRILVANPAAAAESMSLHYQCDYALYLDRTYNAAHYLQSQKRIHRLTEGEERTKHIEIFWSDVIGSIDLRINKSLAEKCHQMFKFLNESKLSIEWVDHSIDLYKNNLLSTSVNEFHDEYMQSLDDIPSEPSGNLII